VVPCIEAGWIQKEIHRSAVLYQRALEQEEKKIVGINCYVEDESANAAIELHRADPAVEREQHGRLAALRKRRDAVRAKRELDAIRDACRSGDNLLERFVSAAHARCTLGEIADVLRSEFGVFKEPKSL
jgi:methylmalonyl-CoA mutase N-terminal domain/subunit